MAGRKTALAATAFAIVAVCGGAAAAFDRASVVSGANLSKYPSVYVAPVKVSLDQSERKVTARDASAKAADLRNDIVGAFERSHTITTGPGPDVLTVSATLTRLVANMPTLADYEDNPSLSSHSIYAGGAAFEATLSSPSGELASVSDRYDGQLDDRRPPVAIWEDADRAFNSWARRLQDFVEEN